MVDLTAILPAPHPEDHRDNKMWVDEQIWGHRLWDSQSPWLLFLEFLNVAEGCHSEERLFDERGDLTSLVFKPHRRMYLRNILFNNEMLQTIDHRYADSSTAWSRWLEWMDANSRGIERPDYSYLKNRFHSFNQFTAL